MKQTVDLVRRSLKSILIIKRSWVLWKSQLDDKVCYFLIIPVENLVAFLPPFLLVAIWNSQVVRYANKLFMVSSFISAGRQVQRVVFRRRIPGSFLQDASFWPPRGPWCLRRWSAPHSQTVWRAGGCWSTSQCLRWQHHTALVEAPGQIIDSFASSVVIDRDPRCILCLGPEVYEEAGVSHGPDPGTLRKLDLDHL